MNKKRLRSKICGRCGEKKSLDSYNFRDKEHKKIRGICKECENHHKANWYQKNKEHHKSKVYERRRKTKEDVRAFLLDYLQSHPCTRCGESDPRVLEFHHVRGKKRHNVGHMVGQGYGIKVIQKEIAKCEVLCANCHRIKTAEEQGWYKS